MSPLTLLDTSPAQPDEAWWFEVGLSLAERPLDWVNAVRDAGSLGDGRPWALLAWVELAATEVVRAGSPSILEVAAFGISLLAASNLDSRDIAVVASLLRRGAQLAKVEFADSAVAGCERSAEFVAAALGRLLSVEGTTPPTHTEVGEGASFSFLRRPVDFDVLELERWLQGDD